MNILSPHSHSCLTWFWNRERFRQYEEIAEVNTEWFPNWKTIQWTLPKLSIAINALLKLASLLSSKLCAPCLNWPEITFIWSQKPGAAHMEECSVHFQIQQAQVTVERSNCPVWEFRCVSLFADPKHSCFTQTSAYGTLKVSRFSIEKLHCFASGPKSRTKGELVSNFQTKGD